MSAERFSVVACSRCANAWVVEMRHEGASCSACGKRTATGSRRRLWQGDSAVEAQAAAAQVRAGLATGLAGHDLAQRLQMQDHVPRHDSPVAAAAAKARGIINKSKRAEAIALALTQLGATAHDDHVIAMDMAGIPRERAEKEIVRMLATDVVFEPRAGHYEHLA